MTQLFVETVRTRWRSPTSRGGTHDPNWGSFFEDNEVFSGPTDYEDDETSIGCIDTYDRRLPGAGIWCEGADSAFD